MWILGWRSVKSSKEEPLAVSSNRSSCVGGELSWQKNEHTWWWSWHLCWAVERLEVEQDRQLQNESIFSNSICWTDTVARRESSRIIHTGTVLHYLVHIVLYVGHQNCGFDKWPIELMSRCYGDDLDDLLGVVCVCVCDVAYRRFASWQKLTDFVITSLPLTKVFTLGIEPDSTVLYCTYSVYHTGYGRPKSPHKPCLAERVPYTCRTWDPFLAYLQPFYRAYP